MSKRKSLADEYRFPGFRPRAMVKGKFGDPVARVIRLERRQKKRFAAVVENLTEVFTTARCGSYGIYRAAESGFIWRRKFVGFIANGAAR